MTIHTEQELVSLLQSKLDELNGRQGSTKEDLVIVETGDPLDKATERSRRDNAAAQANRNQSLIADVEMTLERISEGEYGVCLRCEEAINLKRLEAVPWANYCVPCQEWRERHEKESQEKVKRPLVNHKNWSREQAKVRMGIHFREEDVI